jgi:hypothetical protein
MLKRGYRSSIWTKRRGETTTVALAEIARAIIAKTWITPVYPIISITAWLAITTITTAKALK